MVITQTLLKNHIKYENGFLYWIDFSNKPNAKTSALGNITQNGYLNVGFMKKKFYVHRLVFLYHHGYTPKFIDHINGNKQDNRIENLREVTQCQNMMNVGKTSYNSTGYKGVSYNKNRNKWVAQIKQNKVHFYLGSYDSPEKAYEVYCQKAIELHGQYINLG